MHAWRYVHLHTPEDFGVKVSASDCSGFDRKEFQF